MQDKELINRRGFIKEAAAFAALMSMLGAEEIRAEAAGGSEGEVPAGPPVAIGVIGLGDQGRELLKTLARVAGADVLAICDTYEPFVTRAKELAPKATGHSNYKELLDRKEVQAVIVATPTHLHKQIVLDALQAGKHVYCEAPLAHTIDECKAIASAGSAAKTVFQVGQQLRSSGVRNHALKFVRAGATGKIVAVRAQWHKKTSWRRAASSPEREKELNWRLSKDISTGLMGEVGIHQVDLVSWYLKALPTSVSGFGSVIAWADGRDMADTVQCVFEYPGGVRLLYDATLGNSYDSAHEIFFGTSSAVMLRDERGWMFKEADAPMLGWEVYAKKDKWGDDTGIGLLADASKLLAAGKEPAKESQADPSKTSFYYAMEEFLTCIRQNKKPNCGAVEGYQAAVVALKAHEAVTAGAKIAFQKEWFDLA
ncbi:MAG: Gfo/Idh/MocA family protein [Armatimonadota bacterium]